MAAGRYTSAATSSGLLPRFCRLRASLPATVVLPTPCRPTSMMEVTPRRRARVGSTGPIRATSSSSQTLMKC